MRLFAAVIIITALLAGPAQAQYKCAINGKTIYSDEPCAANAKHVGALEDRVDSRAQAEAEVLRRKERMQRNRIDGQQNAEYQAQQRAAERYAINEEQQALAAEQSRQRRCAVLARDMRGNRRGVAFYQDLAMQRSLTQQEQELKRNSEAFERECR